MDAALLRLWHSGPAALGLELASLPATKESPRGPMSIDPETRDVVHNEYIRKVEKVNGEMYNVEFATIEAVKDPLHGAKK